MNKKGQVLVFFVILIPLLITIAALAIDMGYNLYESNKLHNINRMAVKYGLDHINDNDVRAKVIDLLYKNDNKIDSYELTITNNRIVLKTTKTIESVFGKAINIKFYSLSSKYTGYIDNGKIMIEKG